MKKFKKALRVVLTIAVLSGMVYAVATSTAPVNAYGCDTNGCD